MLSLGRHDQETQAIKEISNQYTAVLSTNYERRQNELLDQLFQQTKNIKQELAFFKREVHPDAIEAIVAERRRDKEKIRQALEAQWRECNQSFKNLQDEQKRVSNQQKENAFDVANLQSKIEEFTLTIQQMRSRIEQLQGQTEFLTEPKPSVQPYESPYKSISSVQQRTLARIQRQQALLAKTRGCFFSQKYSLSQGQSLGLRSRPSKEPQLTGSSQSSSLLKVLRQHKTRQGCLSVDHIDLHLWAFLDSRQVRLRIFKFLKKQI